jgi:hypothetical protein
MSILISRKASTTCLTGPRKCNSKQWSREGVHWLVAHSKKKKTFLLFVELSTSTTCLITSIFILCWANKKFNEWTLLFFTFPSYVADSKETAKITSYCLCLS